MATNLDLPMDGLPFSQKLLIRGLAGGGGTLGVLMDTLPPWARTAAGVCGFLMAAFGPTLALVAQAGLRTYLETRSRAKAVKAAEDTALAVALAKLDAYERTHGPLVPPPLPPPGAQP